MRFSTRLAITAAVVLSSCSDSPSRETQKSLTVIATTDFHGEIEGQSGPIADGNVVTIGGAGIYATYLQILHRHLPGPVLWVDSGDLFQGSMISNSYEGAPVVRLMDYLGLQAAALGNHEFDFGPVGPKAVARKPGDDPRGALRARIQEAHFPTLAANVKTDDGKVPDWLKPSTVVNLNGVKVGVVGGASPNTPSTTNALNLKGLVFEPLLPALRLEAERLRKEDHVDVVVVIMHEGGGCKDNTLSHQDDLSTCQEAGALEFAKALPAGLVDVIVAGHTHQGIAKRVNGISLIEPFSHGKYVGWVTVPLEGKDRRPEVSGLVPVCLRVVTTPSGKTCDPFLIKEAKGPTEPAVFFGETVAADPAVEKLLAPEMAEVKQLKETKLGFQALDTVAGAFHGESALGNLVADLSHELVPHTDLGLTNGGGLRASIAPGPVTYGDIFKVMPFDNQLAIMKVSGAELKKLIEVGAFGNNGSYSWSSNLKFSADHCKLRQVTVDGRRVNPKRTYSIATSDFLAGGGSGVASVKIPKDHVEIFWDHDKLLREMIVKRLENWHRDLRSADFYSSATPRQIIAGTCDRETTSQKAKN